MQGKQWSYLDILLLDGSKIRIILSDRAKSLSEALIFASTNPQYDDRLFIELQVQYMKIASSEHGENMGRTCCVHKLFWMSKQKQKTICVHNMFWACSFHVLILDFFFQP